MAFVQTGSSEHRPGGGTRLTLSLLLLTFTACGGQSASGTKTNNDPPPPPAPPTVAFASTSHEATEGAGSLAIEVVLDATPAADVNLTVTPSGTASLDADYAISPSPLVVAAGATSATLTLTPLDDALVEGDETVVLTLEPQDDVTLGAPAAITVTLHDDDHALTLDAATTLDLDGDGAIDHLRLIFSGAVDDSTFPGYVVDGLGEPQSHWAISGYTEVVFDARTAAMGDAPDDDVIYLAFAESLVPDTDATPELTIETPAGLTALNGVALTAPASLTAADGAPPILMRASCEVGSMRLNLAFSEPVQSAPGSCDAAPIDATAFIYDDASGTDVFGLDGGVDLDGCDGRLALSTSIATPFGSADLGTDAVAPVAGAILDAAGLEVPTTARLVTGVVPPFVLTASSLDETTVRITYSEPVGGDVLLAGAYALSQDDTSPSCGALPSIDAVVTESPSVYRVTTGQQFAGCPYSLGVIGDVRDLDEDAALVEPRAASFVGDESLRVVSAYALSLRSFVVVFSKDVRASGPSCADDAALFDISPELGAITDTVRFDLETHSPVDANKVRVRHSLTQGSAYYRVVVDTALVADATGESLAPDPRDRTTFHGLGGEVTSVSQGALFTDPFGDGTSFAFVFSHGGKVYAGPNDNNDAVFRFDPDGKNAVTVTFQIDSGKAGAPFASFGNHLTRPAAEVQKDVGLVRYLLTPGTDLSSFGADDWVTVTGCTNPTNNQTSLLAAAIDDATGSVTLDDALDLAVADAAETCVVTLHNDAGPADFDGVNAFVSASVAGSDYLVFGSEQLRDGTDYGKFAEVQMTTDVDASLDIAYCDLSAMTLGNTESLQSIFGAGNQLYLAFASDSASGRPIFGRTDITALGGACPSLTETIQVGGGTNGTIHNLAYLGGGNGNDATMIGVDSMVVFDDGSGPALYLANNGGIASSAAIPPTSTTTWRAVRQDDPTGPNPWPSGTTLPIPDIGRLRPGQKGIPFMLVWGSELLVARNRTDGGAELWRYRDVNGDGVSDADEWLEVLDTTSSVGGMNPHNRAISLLAVSGGRLYVGFDNVIDGAELWRTVSGVDAASLASNADFEPIGLSGLGPEGDDLTKNKYLISATSLAYDNADYLYLTVGCDDDFRDGGTCDRNPTPGATDFAIRMFRQVD